MFSRVFSLVVSVPNPRVFAVVTALHGTHHFLRGSFSLPRSAVVLLSSGGRYVTGMPPPTALSEDEDEDGDANNSSGSDPSKISNRVKKARTGGRGGGGRGMPPPPRAGDVDRAAGEGHWADIMKDSESFFPGIR